MPYERSDWAHLIKLSPHTTLIDTFQTADMDKQTECQWQWKKWKENHRLASSPQNKNYYILSLIYVRVSFFLASFPSRHKSLIQTEWTWTRRGRHSFVAFRCIFPSILKDPSVRTSGLLVKSWPRSIQSALLWLRPFLIIITVIKTQSEIGKMCTHVPTILSASLHFFSHTRLA